MRKEDNTKIIGRNDLILAAVVIVAALAFYLVNFVFRDPGASCIVTVNGQEYGSYDLSENQEIPIIIDDVQTNLLIIADGKADMIWADCPDKLCVHQNPIDSESEVICCLPNKVVVTVEDGSKSAELDSVVK